MGRKENRGTQPQSFPCLHIPHVLTTIAATVREGIPGAEGVIFEHSSHMCHAEEPERFQEVVTAFLDRIEGRE